VTNPDVVCRAEAKEGEVCINLEDKIFYESGKDSCYEYKDLDPKYKSSIHYFNTKFKRVLPKSSLTLEPIIYECINDKDKLPTCATPFEGKCKDASDVTSVVNFCKESTNFYKTMGNSCVKTSISEGQLLNCQLNNHRLPICEQVANTEASCMENTDKEIYCVDSAGADAKIYQSTSTSCSLFNNLTNTPLGTRKTYFYFDKEFKRIEMITDTTKIYASYYCTNYSGSFVCNTIEIQEFGEIIKTPNSVEMCISNGNSITFSQTHQEYISIDKNNIKTDSKINDTTNNTVENTVDEPENCEIDDYNLPTCTQYEQENQSCMDGTEGYCVVPSCDNTMIYKSTETTCELISKNNNFEQSSGQPTQENDNLVNNDSILTFKATGNSIIMVGGKSVLPNCKLSGSEVKEDESCQTDTNEVDSCINNNTIYIRKEVTKNIFHCTKLTHPFTFGNSDVVHFTRNYSNKDSFTYSSLITSNSKLSLAYQCEFDANKIATKCKLFKGHYLTSTTNSGYIVSCSGLKDDECSIKSIGSDTNCTSGEGTIKSGGGAICFGNRKIDLPATQAVQYIAFKATSYNKGYGANKGDIVLLELGNNYAMRINKYAGKSSTIILFKLLK